MMNSQSLRIFGGDKPEYFRQMSIGMAEMGFRGIDINMGCPVQGQFEMEKGSGHDHRRYCGRNHPGITGGDFQ